MAWLVSWTTPDEPHESGSIVFDLERGAINRAEEIREECPDDTVTITPLVPADTLAEMQRRVESMQARIDELMLEYCPDEMTDEQRATWAANQRPQNTDSGEL